MKEFGTPEQLVRRLMRFSRVAVVVVVVEVAVVVVVVEVVVVVGIVKQA